MSSRRIGVQWQLDKDSPVDQAIIRYHVSPTETEIVFPTGASRTFPNWDVMGCREGFYRDEWLNVPAEALLAAMSPATGRVCEYGVKPEDVQRFIADLAMKPYYEALFLRPSPPSPPSPPNEFNQIVNILAEGARA